MSIKNELLLIRARIAEKEARLRELNLRADNCIITIRNIVDPNAYDEDFTALAIDRAHAAMQDFYEIWREARELKAKKLRLERELNG